MTDDIVLNAVINGAAIETINGVFTTFYDFNIFKNQLAAELDVKYAPISASTSISTLQNQNTTNSNNITSLSSDMSNTKYQVGDYKHSAITFDHQKWLKCDGRAVSRTTYANLFAILGTAFGSGDGSTTFNLPNPSGRSPVYVGQGSTAEGGGLGTSRALGSQGGTESHVMTLAEMPAHSHTYTASIVANDASISLLGSGNRVTSQPTTNTSTAGSSNAFSLMHPWLAIGNLFIYTG